jgi:hypothetical protein
MAVMEIRVAAEHGMGILYCMLVVFLKQSFAV